MPQFHNTIKAIKLQKHKANCNMSLENEVIKCPSYQVK